MDLETLYHNLGDYGSPEYDAARAAKVAEIAAYISNHVTDDVIVEKVAEAVMDTAEAMGRIHGNTVTGEVRGHHTRDGNPLTVMV